MKAQGIRTPALYIPRAGRQRPCVASGSFDQILALRFSRMTTVPPDLIAKPVGAPVGRDRHRVLPGGATPAETSHALERRYRRGKPSSTQSNRPGASCSNPEKRTPQRPRTIPPESKTPDACLFSIGGSGELHPTYHVAWRYSIPHSNRPSRQHGSRRTAESPEATITPGPSTAGTSTS